MTMRINAGCVCRFGRGVLIAGESGAGKSSLALTLMALGWQLVADDWCDVSADHGVLVARAPDALRGLIEIRGVGIQRAPVRLSATIALQVTLAADCDRLPLPASVLISGCVVPHVLLRSNADQLPERVAEALLATPPLG